MEENKNIPLFEFSSLRSDWYYSNSTMPRKLRNCVEGKERLEFKGFPRQWIPVFELFGITWRDSIAPISYIPIFSELMEEDIIRIVQRAKREKALRILVESSTMYDPVLSDFLYIIDNTVDTESPIIRKELEEVKYQDKSQKKRRLILNGWQSYGRPSIRLLEDEVLKVHPKKDIAVILPCALKRPYYKSNTHKKIYKLLREKGYDIEGFHRIVITSLGVLPEEVWEMPQVLTYDAGVPDIYRILRLVRSYFARSKYKYVLDCLQFQPYSDVLTIAKRESLVKEIKRIKIPGHKHFYIRP